MSQPPDVTQEEDHKKATNPGILSVLFWIFLEETEYWIPYKTLNLFKSLINHQHNETIRLRSDIKYNCKTIVLKYN